MRRFFLAAGLTAVLMTISGSTQASENEAVRFIGDQGFPTLNLTVAHSWSGVAPCLSTGQSEERIIDRVEAAMAGAPLEDAEVRGFQFHQQPKPLIDAFRRMTRLMGRTSVRQPAEPCRDVLCASRALLGEEEAPRLLLLAAVYHYNASDLGELNTRPWTVAELDQLLNSFDDLPPSLFPMNRTEYRALAHKHREEGAFPKATMLFELAAEAGEGEIGIMVAQGWHSANPSERRAIIVHELAHEFTRARGKALNWQARWQAAVDADAAHVTNQPTVASAYATRNLDEDFAESVTAYRYMAPLLKHRGPERYQLLKTMVFEGREYGSATQCSLGGVVRVAQRR